MYDEEITSLRIKILGHSVSGNKGLLKTDGQKLHRSDHVCYSGSIIHARLRKMSP